MLSLTCARRLFPCSFPAKHVPYHFRKEKTSGRRFEISLNHFDCFIFFSRKTSGYRSFYSPTRPFSHSYLVTDSMISATHNNLNIAKDALPSAFSQYNESIWGVVPVQHYNQSLDSSESIPSEHSSIYEAAVASFETFNHTAEVEELAVSTADRATGNDFSKILGGQSDTAHTWFFDKPGSHGAQPRDTLETVMEQRSVALLASLELLPCANPGGFAKAHKPSQSPFSNSRRRNAFSLNDIDARIPGQQKKTLHERLHRPVPSSSSSDAIEQSIPCREPTSPVDPVQPTLPPPRRIPTPPGLPSFGSPEAMRYRQPSRFSHGRRSSSQSSQQLPQTRAEGTADARGNSGSGAFPSRGGSLRRFLLSWVEPQPAPLVPGVVGRAEDGTLVRARFGTRQSGHGIGAGPGSRGLQAHPFHRRTLPVARINEFAQVDGSPHSSRDEGQLSQPEAFAPPRTVRASSSSSHSSLPYPNVSPAPPLRPAAKIKPRTSSHAGSSAAGPSYITCRNSEPRLPRIIETTASSRAEHHAHTPTVPGSETPEENTFPSQPKRKKVKDYWAQFRELCSLFCCPIENEEEVPDRWRRSRQFDGSGDVPESIGRSRNGPSAGRNDGFSPRSRAPDFDNSPWIPAWGCQPGRIMGGDGVSEDG